VIKMFNSNAPMGMPEGSVRAILSLIFAAMVIMGYYLGYDIEPLLPIATFIIGYYFGYRGKT